ncbi:MAG: sulfate permease [Alphaproteobacteria bacterium]|nr:sulfate permease [Alphaproteobacteria bacterium]
MKTKLQTWLPILEWGREYKPAMLVNDLVAALIVTIMLIPQSLAYAMLAGLPPEVGLYASTLPLLAYAVFGTSRTLAVGPVAILSLMTAAAASRVAAPGSAEYIGAAMTLAFLSGGMLLVFGLLRMGFLANFLSHPVVSGFITASGILIAASQVRHLLGVEANGGNLWTIGISLARNLEATNAPTAVIGFATLAALLIMRRFMRPALASFGVGPQTAAIVSRSGPVFAVVAGIAAVSMLRLDAAGVRILGVIPHQLPRIGLPPLDEQLVASLFGSAALISLIGFVESVSVGRTLAAKKRQRVDPNQELVGLGVAGIAAGVSAGFPVTGGLARSAVNFDAGAETPAAGAFTAAGIALATVFLTPHLYYLPQAALAATIIVAVLSLVDLREIVKVWRYSKSDFAAMFGTIVTTLSYGVEIGVTSGVALSLGLHLYNTSRPHFAIVGRVPGTHHFRNVKRHNVITSEEVVTIRIDESLYFANARFLEDTVYAILSERPLMRHLVLMCPAVNSIDASGVESLEAINERLKDAGVTLHLSEVKGPVMDRLQGGPFLAHLTGKVFLSQQDAIAELDPSCASEGPDTVALPGALADA